MGTFFDAYCTYTRMYVLVGCLHPTSNSELRTLPGAMVPEKT